MKYSSGFDQLFHEAYHADTAAHITELRDGDYASQMRFKAQQYRNKMSQWLADNVDEDVLHNAIRIRERT